MSGARRLAPLFVRRNWRRFWRWTTSPHFEIVYHDDYNSAFPNVPADALRAERVLAFLAAEGLVLPCDVHRPLPASIKALRRVHTPEYLDSVHEVRTLVSIMGCDVSEAQVDRLLDLQRLHTGGTILAVRLALRKGFAVNLGGGFHHALAGQGGGFCIFNDVAAALADARERGFAKRVLVVDLDLHDGDGSRAIFAAAADVHTFSVHARDWAPPEGVATTSVELGGEVDDATYLEAIERHLPPLVAEFAPGLVVYLAGTDPAREDRMGDWRITPDGMRRRDTLVACLARGRRGHRIPLAVVLAGGYSQEAWRYTARFLSDPYDRRGPIEPPSTEEMTLKRYRYISSLFDPRDLSGASRDTTFGLTEEDLFLPGGGFHKETRLLGFYTRHGIELVLERAGILDRLRDLGFVHPTLDFDLDDAVGQTMRIFGDPSRREVLMELRLSRDRRSAPDMELLSIEWLLLQNPRASFSEGRRRLPGQEHPGLGMLKDVVALLAAACERLRLDGLALVPAQYHIAVQWAGSLHFLDPEARRRYRALRELFGATPIGQASRAVAEGRVVDAASGEVFEWQPAPMVAPISERLKARFDAEGSDDGGEPRLRLLEEEGGPQE